MTDEVHPIALHAILHALGNAALSHLTGPELTRESEIVAHEWLRADKDFQLAVFGGLGFCLWWATTSVAIAPGQRNDRPHRSEDLAAELDKLPTTLTRDSHKVLAVLATASRNSEVASALTHLASSGQIPSAADLVSAMFETAVVLVRRVMDKHADTPGDRWIVLGQMTTAATT